MTCISPGRNNKEKKINIVKGYLTNVKSNVFFITSLGWIFLKVWIKRNKKKLGDLFLVFNLFLT